MCKTPFFLLFTLLIATQLPAQYIHLNEAKDLTSYSPTGRPRMAAEWEPAIGVLISWPLWIPKELVMALANDTRLYVVAQGMQAQKDAVAIFTKWGIKPNQVKFIPAPLGEDAAWTRDWGPGAVF
ncbi:MAG: agmatine deiminase family protein, partial [Bacteroidota bacterium]|nr:agmatine deiminase family protein [Bacteroidota bacterium]